MSVDASTSCPTCGNQPYERTCDYCAYRWEADTCVHAERQMPCPECDVLPVTQLR